MKGIDLHRDFCPSWMERVMNNGKRLGETSNRCKYKLYYMVIYS
jgi:hypothetical protein